MCSRNYSKWQPPVSTQALVHSGSFRYIVNPGKIAIFFVERDFSHGENRVKRGGKHPTEHRNATETLINITIPSTDRHMSEL